MKKKIISNFLLVLFGLALIAGSIVIINPVFSEEILTEATCTSSGLKKITYLTGKTKEEVIEPLGHQFQYVDNDDATCIANATMTQICIRCSEKGETIIKDESMKEHSYSESLKYDENTHYNVCEICGKKENETVHFCESSLVIKEAIDGNDGIIEYTCTCGYKWQEETSHKHNYIEKVIDDKYLKRESDCINKAVYYYSCSCGLKGTETFEYGSPKGHTYGEYIYNNDATCSSNGTKTAKCIYCDAIDTLEAINTIKDHTYDSSWTSDENYHWHNATCGHIENVQSKESHTWDDGVLLNNTECSNDTKIKYTCLVCKKTKEEYASSHDFVLTKSKDATCTDSGYNIYKCTKCNKEKIETIDIKGHIITNPTTTNVATCETSGTIEGNCDICHQNVSLTISALGHKESKLIFSNEYCGNTKIGYTTCLNCGEVINTFGHNYIKNEKEATCLENGSIIYTCVNCNDTYSTTIDPIGHVEGDWEVISNPSCLVCGEEIKKCIICDCVLETRKIDCLDHNYVSEKNDNVITYTCSNCKYSYQVETENTHTITFISNGGTAIENIIVADNESIVLPIPSKDSFVFNGWYLEEELLNLCEDDYKFNEDITLYANWVNEEINNNYDTNNIITNVPLDFKFAIKTECLLNDNNLANYVHILDDEENTPKIYIASKEDNIYYIASDEYKNGTTYSVIITDELECVDTDGNEFWFIVDDENYHNIKYKDNVKFVSENEVYSYSLEDEIVYLYFKKDLLNVDDVFVIYGESKDDILLTAKVSAEGVYEFCYIYQIVSVETDDVFLEYNAFYSGELDVYDFDFEENIEEELLQQLYASPLYAQIQYVATEYALDMSNDRYMYDFNGIKPNFKSYRKDNRTCFKLEIVTSYSKSNLRTLEITDIFSITLQIDSSFGFKPTISLKSIKNFSFVLETNNVTNIKLFASIGKGSSIEDIEIDYFEALLRKSKKDGNFNALDSVYAENENITKLGSLKFNFYGVILAVDVANVYNFQAVGEVGTSVQTNFTLTLGVKCTPKDGFKLIHSTKFEANISFYMLGKIEVCDEFELSVSISALGLVTAYFKASVGPYFMVGGMFSSSISTGGGKSSTFGGYLEAGFKVESEVGIIIGKVINLFGKKISLTILDKSWPIYNNRFCLFSLGEKEVALYFEDKKEEKTVEYTCSSDTLYTETLDVSKMIDKVIVYQDLTDMSKDSREADDGYYYYLCDEYSNVKLTSKGILKIKLAGISELTINIKIKNGDVYKTLILNIKVNHQGETIDRLEPTCLSEGHSEYVKCRICNTILSEYEVLEAKGHSYSEEWSSNDDYHWHNATCEHTSKISDYAKHTWNEGEVIIEADCLNDGLMRYECTVCHAQKENIINAKGHIYDQQNISEKYLKSDFECGKRAVYYYSCICGEKGTKTFEFGEIASHNYESVKISRDYTKYSITFNPELEDVSNLKNMIISDYAKLSSIYKSNEILSKYSASFFDNYSLLCLRYDSTRGGLKNADDCIYYVYDGVLKYNVDFEIESEGSMGITMLSYGMYLFEIDKAYCQNVTSIQSMGKDLLPIKENCLTKSADYQYCTICGNYSKEEKDILPHKLGEWIEEIEATHESCGIKGHYHCSMCDLDYEKDGKTIIYDLTILPLSHVYDQKNIDSKYLKSSADCCHKAVYYYSCICGEKGNETFEYGEYGDHNYVDGVCSICKEEEYSVGLEYTLINNDTEYEVSGIGTCKDVKVIIPSRYNNLPITSIGDSAFTRCSSLTSITIGNNVTSIGDSAFTRCSSLTSITIGNNVTSIGDSAFTYCGSLTSVKIGNSVTNIGNSAFTYCSSLISVKIGNSVTNIGNGAFSYCYSLRSIEIPNSVISIGGTAFFGCYRLVEVINKSKLDITKGSYNYGFVSYYALCVKTSGESEIVNKNDYLFYTYDKVNYLLGYVGSSKELTLPNNYEQNNYQIYKYAFYDCVSLTSIEIPNSVTSIGNYAFYDCNSLTSIAIGNNVTSIGNYAFSYCYSLTSIEIPNSVISIGADAFSGCSSLTSIEIPNSVISIGYSSFSSCRSLTSIEISNSVTSIGDRAFYDCYSLTSITMGNNVTSIGGGAFLGCYKLVEVINKSKLDIIKGSNNYGYVSYYALCVKTSGESEIVNKNDYLFYTYDKVNYLLGYVGGSKELTLPNNYEQEKYQIYKYAFSNCYSLASIEIPNSVTSIGDYAFSDCYSLESIEIPNSVTSIGDYAFSKCYLLKSIELPKSVTNIGEHSFEYLNVIYYKGNKTEWENIIIGSHDKSLVDIVRYYSSTFPTNFEDNTYWHYVDNVPTIWKGGDTYIHITPATPYAKNEA